MGWFEFFFTGSEPVEVLNLIARLIPAWVMFPVVFLVMQGVMTGTDAHNAGAAVAIRATLLGAHLNIQGLAWSVGVASFMTLWGVIARAIHPLPRTRP